MHQHQTIYAQLLRDRCLSGKQTFLRPDSVAKIWFEGTRIHLWFLTLIYSKIKGKIIFIPKSHKYTDSLLCMLNGSTLVWVLYRILSILPTIDCSFTLLFGNYTLRSVYRPQVLTRGVWLHATTFDRLKSDCYVWRSGGDWGDFDMSNGIYMCIECLRL